MKLPPQNARHPRARILEQVGDQCRVDWWVVQRDALSRHVGGISFSGESTSEFRTQCLQFSFQILSFHDGDLRNKCPRSSYRLSPIIELKGQACVLYRYMEAYNRDPNNNVLSYLR